MKKIKIREMNLEDLDFVLVWRNHEAIRNNMYNSHTISLSEHKNWFQKSQSNATVINLIFEIDNVPKGVIAFSKIDKVNATAEWAFYSGDLKTRGVGTLMELCALRYAFNILNLRKLNCEVLSFNESVIKFHKKFCFRQEGIKAKHFIKDGKEFDIHLLALFKSDWQDNIGPLEEKYLDHLEVEL